MSISSEISRINGNIANAYTAVSSKGGTLPTARNSANLPTAILSIPSGVTPSGKLNITDTSVKDVTNYAQAQVVDANLIAENIKKDVTILGKTGTYEGGGSGDITAIVPAYSTSSTYNTGNLVSYGNKIYAANENGITGAWNPAKWALTSLAEAIEFLAQRISDVGNIGKYLTIWNCTTGLPTTNPATMPYAYKTGDYFIIGNVSMTNYMPDGTIYDGTASTTVDTGSPQVLDMYRFDGTSWSWLDFGQQFRQILSEYSTTAQMNAAIEAHHDSAKQDVISDLTTIRSGAALGATAVQPEAGKGLFSGSYNDLTNKPTIPVALADLTDDTAHRLVSDSEKSTWNNKQNSISDLTDIRSGAALGATAVQPEAGKGLFSGSYNDLTNKPTIPSALSDLTADSTHRVVTDTEKSAWNAKYNKPSMGIPKTDLASAVQTSLGKADSALQQETDPTVPSWAKQPNKPSYTAAEITDNGTTVAAEISDINDKISSQATSTNKLVSASEMGDAIAAVEAKQLYANATQGQFATKADLIGASIYYNADGTLATPTKNDIAYVLADESHDGKSAKYVIAAISGATITWGFVITFSTTTFSQEQMDAINSGVTQTKRGGYDSHVGNGDIHVTASQKTAWSAKQDAISDLATIRSGAALGATAVQPEAGKGLFSGNYNDLTNKPTIPAALADLTDDAAHRLVSDSEKSTWNNKQNSISDLTDIRSGAALGATAVQPEAGKGLFSGNYNDLTNKPTIPVALANLTDDATHRLVTDSEKSTWNGKQAAISDLTNIRNGAALGATAVQPEAGKGLFSGSYTDLTNKPSIPAAQVNADWNSTSGVSQILNKPSIPTVPTNVSAFTNDAGYLTSHQSLGAYRTAAAQDTIDAGKVDEFTLDLYTGSAGNPRPVKFLTVNYSGTDSNNAVFVTLSAMSCHPNGSSYKFAEDITIGVAYNGSVGVDVQQSIRSSCGTVDGAEHFYGDVFYVVNTGTTTVDFFIYCGQWAHTKFTPYKRRNGATAGTITQYSGTATYYSSGTKVYGNNGLIATKGMIPDISGKLDANKLQYSATDIGEGAPLATGTFYFVYE